MNLKNPSRARSLKERRIPLIPQELKLLPVPLEDAAEIRMAFDIVGGHAAPRFVILPFDEEGVK